MRSVSCLTSIFGTESPVTATRPVAAKWAIRPNAYRSLRPSTWSPDACSGLMYSGVPTTSPTRVSAATAWVFRIDREMPKSITQRAPGRPLQHHVVRLDVAVDHTAAVRIGEGVRDVLEHSTDLARGQWTGPLHSLCQRLAFDEAHGVGEDVSRFLHRVHRDDVGVREPGGGSRLEKEPLAQRGLLGEFGRQDLERDRPIEPEVAREIDTPHPPAAKLALEMVAGADGGADAVQRGGGRFGDWWRHATNTVED